MLLSVAFHLSISETRFFVFIAALFGLSGVFPYYTNVMGGLAESGFDSSPRRCARRPLVWAVRLSSALGGTRCFDHRRIAPLQLGQSSL